jgi:hypothetical protein
MSSEAAPQVDRYGFFATYYGDDFAHVRPDWHEVETAIAHWRVYPYSDGERKIYAIRTSLLGVIDSFHLNLDNPDATEHVVTDGNRPLPPEMGNMTAQVDMGLIYPNDDELGLLDELIESLVLETAID